MIYTLKNCRDGEIGKYNTTLSIAENQEGELCFHFEAESCQYYCPEKGYNKIHSRGDAVELLIGSDVQRKVYYEIELNPNGELMIAKMTYQGVDENGKAILNIQFEEECFVRSDVKKTKNGYIAELRFHKNKIMTGDGDIFFNAYRLETDGGEMEKHLLALIPTMCGRFHEPQYYVYLKNYLTV